MLILCCVGEVSFDVPFKPDVRMYEYMAIYHLQSSTIGSRRPDRRSWGSRVMATCMIAMYDGVAIGNVGWAMVVSYL